MPALAEPSAVAYPTVTVEVEACPAVPLRSTGTSTEPAEASTVAVRASSWGVPLPAASPTMSITLWGRTMVAPTGEDRLKEKK